MQRQTIVLMGLFCSAFFSFKALGVEKTLCTMTSDVDDDVEKIVYEMDEDNRAFKHLYEDKYRNEKLMERIELQAQELKDGIVLSQKDKHIIVRLQSDNFDLERGGILYLDTLYSGVSGERKEYPMEMALEVSGPVIMSNKEAFSAIKFVAKRSKLLGVIGIEKVIFGNN